MFKSIWKTILAYILKKEYGNFELAQGKHNNILIKLKRNPKSIWINTKSGKYSGCGQNKIDAFGYILTKKGFIFFTNIKSSKCKVNWMVKY